MRALPRKAACIGGGVIGAGWIARLVLNGVDVNVFDPDPQASRKVGEVMANAEKAYKRLAGDGGLPAPGKITYCNSLQDAVRDADLVQESVPERMDLKHKVLAEIDAHAPSETVIGSSTSGLLPSEMQSVMARPERLVVAHPYNPVYLLPLVEIVGGRQTAASAVARAEKTYASIGMKPVIIRKEIEAFVGDRLLEAVWREALWLIRDGICTVEELDDIMRYSFGLRWAQMGLFQVYRIAGGEAGMRHFMAQFGPALQWPWSKLTDVPEFNDELVDLIASQSDAQSDKWSIRELESIRDENLTAIMDALGAARGGEGWGAGALMNEYKAHLAVRAAKPEGSEDDAARPGPQADPA
ncbi:3-hydroxyacyl-CoA dehydrogenase NAD-binding domain-containing protein [Tepidamorphus sp. 3E244]|uniref:3-hydroxyacyl-CoA dehydrogenase NAD-binding domain-containing protein n=1 Tax=Tepidamorphus sp. 3E244 TaxID=3385498 RepID=UPI0038FC2CCB